MPTPRAARRWAVGGLTGVVVCAAGTAYWLGRPDPPRTPAPPVATAAVTRRTLVAQTEVDATLGYAGRYTVVNRAAGTVTWLPGAGRTVRQGEPLYRIDGRPVLLMYGSMPAYRTLTYGVSGRDVAALNADLVRLRYASRAELDPHSRYFGAETAAALTRLQDRRGLPETGTLPLGQAVFLPGAARVTASLGIVAGMPAPPGAALLTATSTEPVVTIALDAAQQAEVARGDRVAIALPGGRSTPGVVTSVGSVAARAQDGTSTVTVRVRPTRPAAARGLDKAPVQVSIVTGRARDALVVPVSALLARAGGRYAVEVAGPRGRYLANVSPALFDDADGLVQVTGRLAAGQRVVVPAA